MRESDKMTGYPARVFPRSSRNIAKELDEDETRVKSAIDFYENDDNLENKIIEPETSFEMLLRSNLQLFMYLRIFPSNFRLSERLVKDKRHGHLTTLFTLGNMTLFAICQARSFVIIWSTDPDYAVAIFTVLLTSIFAIVKGFRVWQCQIELHKLLIHLKILWDKSRFNVNSREKTLKSSERASLMRSWYIIVTIVSSGLYAMRPYLVLALFKLSHRHNDTFDYSSTVYPILHPFVIDTMEKHLACVVWEQFIAGLYTFYWLACDTMYVQLVTHVTIQFQVLQYDLKSIKLQSDSLSVSDEKKLLRKLCSIAQRHSDLFAHCETIEAIYNPVIFLTMLTVSINMCFCVLNMEKELMNGKHEAVAKNVCHIMTLVAQSMIYCGYADNLTDQSFRVAHAAYECDWMDRGNTFKVVLQLIIMRAQKLYIITGYGFFNMTLNQITVIVNTAMSYFTLLKAVT